MDVHKERSRHDGLHAAWGLMHEHACHSMLCHYQQAKIMKPAPNWNPHVAAASTSLQYKPQEQANLGTVENESKGCEDQARTKGLLQQPPDWLDKLIKSLPGEDKLALFRTCMQLAKQVLQSGRRVKLLFNSAASASTLQTRQQVITQILDVGCDFTVGFDYPGPQPFPTLLGDRVRCIRIQKLETQGDAGTAAPTWPWESLVNLQSVRWFPDTTQRDIIQLCEAVEQGHLPRLTSMWMFCENYLGCDAQERDPLFKRLALALGPRLVELDSTTRSILNHLQHFQQLHSINTYWDRSWSSMYARGLFTTMLDLPNLLDIHVNMNCVGPKSTGNSDGRRKRLFIGTHWHYQLLVVVHWHALALPAPC